MNLEERQLITQVFEHIGSLPREDKDADADRLIRESVARSPDAPYRLVQSLLLQQQEMHRLEERVRDLEFAARTPSGSQYGGSFLSSSRGTDRGAVPQVSGRGEQYDRDDRTREAATPPPLPQGPGFLASALTTATGVAGGMLLTNELSKLFGGGSSSGPSSILSSPGSLEASDRSSNEVREARSDAADARRELAEDDALLDADQDALDAQSDSAWDFGEA